MKTILFFLSIFCTSNLCAQIAKPKEVAKQKATDRANNAIDRNIDKGLDAVEEGIGNIFKKKEKPAESSNSNGELERSREASSNSSSNTGYEQGRESNSNKDLDSGREANQNSNANAVSKEDRPKFNANSKFDFVPGEKVIGFDDFSETSVGDFPLGWNTNSAGEIITFNDSPEKWLFMSQDGYFQPDFVSEMPDNFTLEYDIFTRFRSNNLLNYNFFIYASQNPKSEFTEKYISNGFYFNWSGGTEFAGFEVYENGELINKNESLVIKSLTCKGEINEEPSKVHFSIWRQKSRLRIYANNVKVLDIPKAFDPKLKYNAFKLGSSYMNFSEQENKDEYMVANVRYAVGAPDTRSKLITEGRFSTTGILFDVNSDRIKPASEGTLKEIAKVLTENPTVKIKIIGHTDADGADTANQILSEKRAASVKKALASDFGIAADRMLTEGKGESQPVDKNDTPAGKANNRRVEFVKL